MRRRRPRVLRWGVLAGGLAGAGGWALGVPLVMDVLVGGGVLAVQSAIVTAVRRRDAPHLLPVRGGSPEAAWVRRAEVAVARFRRLTESAEPGPVAERCAAIGAQAGETLEDLRRLAGQASLVEKARMTVNEPALRWEVTRLEGALRSARDRGAREDVQRALDAVRAQQEVARRLLAAEERLFARLEAAAIQLEGLVARLAEVVALTGTTSTVPEGPAGVEQLAAELDGVRQGLLEVEQVGRQAIGLASEPGLTAT